MGAYGGLSYRVFNVLRYYEIGLCRNKYMWNDTVLKCLTLEDVCMLVT